MCNQPLYQVFGLVFGTSTGAIIGALLALGLSIDEIHKVYRAHVPAIMRDQSRSRRSKALAGLAREVFQERTFKDFRTDVGIIATHWDLETPRIFKTSAEQAHGRTATFAPGFGCTIADAIRASCSAYPFFEKAEVRTGDGDLITLIDGGYCANNPTLYAIADAVNALSKPHSELRVVSLGVGIYPEPKKWGRKWIYEKLTSVRLLQKTLNVNTLSMEQLRTILFGDVSTVRISEAFSTPEMATDLMEHNLAKLNMLYQRGRESFAKHEADIRDLLAKNEAFSKP